MTDLKNSATISDDIQVELTDDLESFSDVIRSHCFKLTFHPLVEVAPNHPERVPVEIFLHSYQAFDLFSKLGQNFLNYFARESGRLLRMKADELRKLGESHEG